MNIVYARCIFYQEPLCCPSGWLSPSGDPCNPCRVCAKRLNEDCGGREREKCAKGLTCNIDCEGASDVGAYTILRPRSVGVIDMRRSINSIYCNAMECNFS